MNLSSRSKSPPGGWHFRHPISGVEFALHSWIQLRGAVDKHCEGNGYPPISDAAIEEQICSRLGDQMYRWCEGDGLTVRGIGLTWQEIARGTMALGSFLLHGRQRVPQEEAERRAGICRTCPMNVFFSRPCGGGCPELNDAVQSIIGDATTSNDAHLEACAICGCSNRAQVHVPIESLQHGVNVAEFIEKAPIPCWKRVALIELSDKTALQPDGTP